MLKSTLCVFESEAVGITAACSQLIETYKNLPNKDKIRVPEPVKENLKEEFQKILEIL